MNILIVDDDPTQHRLFAVTLARLGHQIREAADGQAGWEEWQRAPAQMVITDWMMPGLEGPELVRKIRAASAADYTYLILLTARGSKQDVVTGLEAGADDYLIKPFDPAELR